MIKNNLETHKELKQLVEMIQINLNFADQLSKDILSGKNFLEEELDSIASLLEIYYQASVIIRKKWLTDEQAFADFFDKLPIYLTYLKNFNAKKDQRAQYKLQVIFKSIQVSYQAIQ